MTDRFAQDYAMHEAPNDGSADAARLAELDRFEIMDTEPELRFERIVSLARALFDAPGAAISLIDTDRQWFKSRSGMGIAEESSRGDSFCNHAIRGQAVLVVPDAREDDRFKDNPLVGGPPYIRFYAGAPLRTERGVALGALCILSPDPRDDFAQEDQRRLQALAGVVMNEMELRLKTRDSAQNTHNKELQIKTQLEEAYLRIRNKLEYSDLIADIQAGLMPIEKISALAVAAWEQHLEADGILANSIRSLRSSMSQAEYKTLLKAMPGFTI